MMRPIVRVLPSIGTIAVACLPLGDLDEAASGHARHGGAGGSVDHGAGSAGENTAGGLEGTAGTSTAGRRAAGGLGGTAGTSTAGASTAGTSTAGASTAGASTAGASTAGASTAGASTAGTSTAGRGAAGSPGGAAGKSGSNDAGAGGSSNHFCGDGKVDIGEECDDAGLSERCNPDCTAAVCPEGCSCTFMIGQRYMFCPAQTRLQAKELCRNAHMVLIRIDSYEENTRVREFATRVELAAFLWLGARDRQLNGVWSWEDGEVFFDVSGNTQTDAFNQWGEGQPSGGECAVISGTGSWIAVSCGDAEAVACEYSASV